jgi:ribosomal protein S20
LAKTPRTWTGARSPSGLKRVRNSQRRNAVLQPRRSAAKTHVAKALSAATQPTEGIDPAQALAEALSALDRAAKVGAIHPNAAARRKSRLTIKVNAALGGTTVSGGGRATKTTGKAAAQKAARARIAASRADKAKGAQTAAGKARAALSRTARDAAAAAAASQAEAKAPDTAAPKKTAATKASGAKAAAPKAKAAAKTTAARTTASKTTASKTTASKTTASKAKAAPKAKKA